MGTNYQFKDTDIHIGKRIGLGAGKGCKFLFAVSISPAHFEMPYPYSPGLADVVDEYGNEQTWSAFLELIHSDEFDWTHVGEEFC